VVFFCAGDRGGEIGDLLNRTRKPRFTQCACDPWTSGALGDDGARRMHVKHASKTCPVQAAIVSAQDQRHGAALQAFQRRQRSIRRGADRVVDPFDAIANAQ
jgi:hypothetical protein